MAVAAGRIVLTGEGIAGPIDDDVGVDGQHVPFAGAVVAALEGRVLRHGPCLLGELLVLRDDGVGEHRSLVVEYADDLCPTFEQGGTDESEDKYDGHGTSEEEPSLPFL